MKSTQRIEPARLSASIRTKVQNRAFFCVLGFTVVASGEPTMQRIEGPSEIHLAKKAAPEGAVVTYTGLRVHDDGSATLRVEVSKQVPVRTSAQGTEVRVFLEGARITIKNNRNPLLAQHFATNVVSAEIVPSKAGVTVVVRLRNAVPLETRVVEQAGGGSTVRIDVPAPSPPAAPPK